LLPPIRSAKLFSLPDASWPRQSQDTSATSVLDFSKYCRIETGARRVGAIFGGPRMLTADDAGDLHELSRLELEDEGCDADFAVDASAANRNASAHQLWRRHP